MKLFPPKKYTQYILHGDVRTDEYAWLRERGHDQVVQYLESENEHTRGHMVRTKQLEDQLFQEMRSRISEDDASVPEQYGEYWYYTRIEKDKQFVLYCRKKYSLEADEEIILDVNTLSDGKAFFQIGSVEVSHDHRYVAYTVDEVGNEQYTLYVKDLEQHTSVYVVADACADVLAFGGDGTVYYVTLDHDTQRPYRIMRRPLQALAIDTLLWEELDDRFHLSVVSSRSGSYVFLYAESGATNEVRYVSSSDPCTMPVIFWERIPGVEYYVDHSGEYFYVRTNEGAADFRIVRVPVAAHEKRHSEIVLKERPGVLIERIDAFCEYLAIIEREQGVRRIRTLHLLSHASCYVQFPEPAYACSFHDNPEFHTSVLRFTYESFTTPDSVYDYHMDTCTMELKKQECVEGEYDASQYITERIHAKSHDGTQIPISLVYRKDKRRLEGNPLILWGYGAYGAVTDADFSSDRLSLLDRGYIYAIAHVRGGGEMGRAWHTNGKFLQKKNTFYDFIACAEHLIRIAYTTKDMMCAVGCSAGGLLVGSVLTMRPDLFRAAVLDVPFVDVLNTMLDQSLTLTAHEYEEWGDPRDEEYYTYIKSYAPYECVKNIEGSYPRLLVMAGYHDIRVPYWEPAKFVARIRDAEKDANGVFLYTNMHTGHGYAPGRYDVLREIAFQYAFIIDALERSSEDYKTQKDAASSLAITESILQ